MFGRVLFWILVLGLLGGLVLLLVLRSQETKPATAHQRVVRVRVQRPTLRDLPIRFTYPAELQAIQAVEIRPVEAKGFIRKLTVDKGDKVRTGQLLVSVDCPEYHERKKQALQQVRSATAVLTNAN